MATLTAVWVVVSGCCIMFWPILLVMVNVVYADGDWMMDNTLVVGLGKIDMVFAVGFVFLTDAGMQPPIIFSTVLVVTTGLSSKNTPAWLNILVPSDKPGKVFTLKITAPLHCGQTVLSKRLMAGKSNLTTLFKPSFIMAIFIVFEAMTIFSDAGFTVAGKVSIT